MKKFFIACLSAVFIISGCSSNEDTTTQEDREEEVTTQQDDTTTENETKVESVFPEEVLGKWITNMNDETYELTYYEDGTITLNDNVGKVTAVEEVGENLYRYTEYTDESTYCFVITGVGGIGVKYDYGFYYDEAEDALYMVVWSAKVDEEINYTFEESDKPKSVHLERSESNSNQV